MKNCVQVKSVLLGGAALAFFMVPSFAQEQTMETVTVTGMRASLQSAQSIKQNSDQVVDSITAVDIGALPDSSVAEALQRVPGVQITRTDQIHDPMRWAGFGNGVFVRGLSWVNSLTNGHETFGAENGRTISFADISADLMGGVDVFKNPDATMIEGGVGGTVDLKTRKPFDQEGRKLAVSGSMDYGWISDHVAPSINALYSDRFDTKVGEVGVLLSADYQDLYSSNNLMVANAYVGAGSVNGQAVHYPLDDVYGGRSALSYTQMNWRQPRVAFDATLQWRPTDKMEVTFTGIWSKAEPTNQDHRMAWRLNQNQTDLNGYYYASDGTWQGGTIHNAEGQSTVDRYDSRHHINGSYALNAKYNPTSHLEISLDAQYVDSRSYVYSLSVESLQKNNQWCAYSLNGWNGSIGADNSGGCAAGTTYYPNAAPIDVTYDVRDTSPAISFSNGAAALLANQSRSIWGAAMDHYENNYAHAYTTRGDAKYTFDGEGLFGLLTDVQAGYRLNFKASTTKRTTYNWNPISFESYVEGYAGYADNAAMASAIATVGDFSTVASNATQIYKGFRFFDSQIPATWGVKSSVLANFSKTWSAIQQVEAATTAAGYSGLWTPMSITAGCSASVVPYRCDKMFANLDYSNVSGAQNGGGVNRQKEDTYAGYVQLNYAKESPFGLNVPIDGNVGVRIVSTDTDSGVGYLMIGSVQSCAAIASGGGVPIANCSDRNDAYNFVGNGGGNTLVASPAVQTSYTDILPSVNFRAHLSDTLQMRLAYSKGVVRPDFDKSQNYTQLTFSFQDGGNAGTFATAYGGKTGNGSNPNLKPLKSDNFDASIEWYFAPTGHVSAALFYKDVKDYFMTGPVLQTITRNGLTEAFTVTSWLNGSKGKVQGFELDYSQFYDFLPGALSGLGLQANYTKIYNKGGANGKIYLNDKTPGAGLPMEGMSNDSYNVALLYAKYDIDARIAYNWRSHFLVASDAANLGYPVWQGNYGQVDGSVLYSFLDHYKAGIQVANLFKQTTVLQIGYMAYHPNNEWIEGERKISLVLRANW